MSELFPNVKEEKKESKSYKVSLDVTLQEIEKIEDELGTLSEIQRETFVDSIRRGNLSFNSAETVLTYKLEKPVGQITELKFPELSTSQLQEISKGDVISANQKGEMQIAMKSVQIQRAVRLLNKVCNCSLSDIDKIKKRDLGVILMIADFLG